MEWIVFQGFCTRLESSTVTSLVEYHEEHGIPKILIFSHSIRKETYSLELHFLSNGKHSSTFLCMSENLAKVLQIYRYSSFATLAQKVCAPTSYLIHLFRNWFHYISRFFVDYLLNIFDISSFLLVESRRNLN